MTKVITLADRLIKQGDQFIQKHGLDHFDDEAANLLAQSNFASSFDYQELVEASLSPKFGEIQNFNSFEFSDLPLTIGRGENCFIDIYFWRRRPTVIHNHHFSGAFQCLTGTNVDLEFEFKKTRKLGKHHSLGELTMLKSRELKKGDIAPIGFMDKFIHQNHHQADLTVNLCFRTPEIKAHNIANYLYSGLRFEKDKFLLDRVQRLLRFVGMEEFDQTKLKLTLDDAISLLIQTYGTSSGNPRLLKLIKTLHIRVKSELEVDVLKMLAAHEKELDRIEDLYD